MRRPLALLGVLALLGAAPVQAHLMENQQGTLNLVGQRGYLVLSLPVSALKGVDDNRDRRLDAAELQRHAAVIERYLRARVRVSDANRPAPLDGVLLNLSPDDHHREGPATHLVLLAVAMFETEPRHPQIELQIFGRAPAERSYRFSATRREPGGRPREEVVRFTPKTPRHTFFD
jgi:hypothetical protein